MWGFGRGSRVEFTLASSEGVALSKYSYPLRDDEAREIADRVNAFLHPKHQRRQRETAVAGGKVAE